ncbi:2-(3-amino-3-carboxypropyl)histidine synthase subunit 2 [Malaya genurostris]|uniref:2-(3-amino-3-carboxypropyl)histidine synthase subunit 2 n=1 Tax=Malaya genurostris TaxID=325434 RepID=UPI0026F3EECF|nr:2-(3-amino-3-carboxypropyl)histidine synthase subunit 2 [Malaya genurostris]
MTAAFSSNDSSIIERQVDQVQDEEICLESFWSHQELKRCVAWINEYSFKKICLQFPDALLPCSTTVVEQLQQELPTVELFVLGDTSYGSCCVDEIAASHVNADGVLHFGHACLSRSNRLPTKYVFPRSQLNTDCFMTSICEQFSDPDTELAIFYDVSYAYCIEEIENLMKGTHKKFSIGQLSTTGNISDQCWKLDGKSFEEAVCIFIGRDNRSFFNTSNSIQAKQWFRFDPYSNALNLADPLDSRWFRRRLFYIEKCKDATSLGIVVATLTASGYLDVVSRIQKMARARNIRTYIISVGKINPAKLANFSEIDCFVLVGCPENDLFTSRDFFKPLVSVYECELAFNPAWIGQFPTSYSTNFIDILPAGRFHKEFDPDSVNSVGADISLVTGKVRNITRREDDKVKENTCQEIQLRGKNELAQVTSGEAFLGRSWQGLEQNLGRDAPAMIEEGRSGIPIKYANDLDQK